jgi:hypothetical protein
MDTPAPEAGSGAEAAWDANDLDRIARLVEIARDSSLGWKCVDAIGALKDLGRAEILVELAHDPSLEVSTR